MPFLTAFVEKQINCLVLLIDFDFPPFNIFEIMYLLKKIGAPKFTFIVD